MGTFSRSTPSVALRLALIDQYVPDGDARSSLFRLKDYPKSANAAAIKGDIVRLRLSEYRN